MQEVPCCACCAVPCCAVKNSPAGSQRTKALWAQCCVLLVVLWSPCMPTSNRTRQPLSQLRESLYSLFQRALQPAAKRKRMLCAQGGPALTPAGVKREASEALQGGEPEHPPLCQAPAAIGPAVTGPADEEGLAEFSRMLSVFTHCGRLKVVAQLLRPSNQHSSSILSSIEFDRDSEVLFFTPQYERRSVPICTSCDFGLSSDFAAYSFVCVFCQPCIAPCCNKTSVQQELLSSVKCWDTSPRETHIPACLCGLLSSLSQTNEACVLLTVSDL